MKLIVFAFFCLLFGFEASAESDTCFLCHPIKNHLMRYGLQGNVKSVILYESHPKPTPKRIEKNKNYSSVQTFYDIDGNMTERQYIFMSRPSKVVYLYDENDRMKEIHFYDAADFVESKSVHTYDAGQRLHQTVSKDHHNNVTYKSEAYYDDRGNVIEYRTYYFEDGESAMSKWEASFDSTDMMVEMRSYDLDGSLSSRQTYKHDEHGNIISTCVLDTSDVMIEFLTYRYNEYNDEVEMTHMKNGTVYENKKTAYTYDDHSNWTWQVSVSTYMNLKREYRTIMAREIVYYD